MSLQDNSLRFLRTINIVEKKAIQADLGIFTHIVVYSGICRHIQTYSGIIRYIWDLFRYIQGYSEICIFRTLEHSEKNSDIFRTRDIFRSLIYSEPKHIHNPAKHLRLEHFAKNFSCFPIFIIKVFYEINIMIFFNTGQGSQELGP